MNKSLQCFIYNFPLSHFGILSAYNLDVYIYRYLKYQVYFILSTINLANIMEYIHYGPMILNYWSSRKSQVL